MREKGSLKIARHFHCIVHVKTNTSGRGKSYSIKTVSERNGMGGWEHRSDHARDLSGTWSIRNVHTECRQKIELISNNRMKRETVKNIKCLCANFRSIGNKQKE